MDRRLLGWIVVAKKCLEKSECVEGPVQVTTELFSSELSPSELWSPAGRQESWSNGPILLALFTNWSTLTILVDDDFPVWLRN